MRFKPGTTQAQMQAAMEALANRPKTRGPAGVGGTRPYGRGGPPPEAIDYPRPVGGTRPYGGSRNLGTAAGPGGGRPGMGVPSSQINPAQPNVMGFPDSPQRSFGRGGPPPEAIDPVRRNFDDVRAPGMGGASPYTINKPSGIGGTRPYGGSADLGTAAGPGGGRPDMLQPQQAMQQQSGPPKLGINPVFKKGGKVSAKAPVKKAAGGKVAAKAPVKKAMGGKVAAKPMSRPVAKAKPMARPMPAMKRGGKVMMKGKYK